MHVLKPTQIHKCGAKSNKTCKRKKQIGKQSQNQLYAHENFRSWISCRQNSRNWFLRQIIIEKEDSKGQQVLPLAQQLDKYFKTTPDWFQSNLLLKMYSEGNSKPPWIHLSVLHNFHHLIFPNILCKSTCNFVVIESNYFFTYSIWHREKCQCFLYKNFLHAAKVTTSKAPHMVLLQICTSIRCLFCNHVPYLTHLQSENFDKFHIFFCTSTDLSGNHAFLSAWHFAFGFTEFQHLSFKYFFYLSESFEFQHHVKGHLQPFPAHSSLQISCFIF